MKHILNNLSNEEKNSIREQHEGGKSFDTSKFKKLMESQLGNVKPLVVEREQITGLSQQPITGGTTSSQGISGSTTSPEGVKTVTPKIEIDCTKKLITSSQLPKFDRATNVAMNQGLINYYCQAGK